MKPNTKPGTETNANVRKFDRVPIVKVRLGWSSVYITSPDKAAQLMALLTSPEVQRVETQHVGDWGEVAFSQQLELGLEATSVRYAEVPRHHHEGYLAWLRSLAALAEPTPQTPTPAYEDFAATLNHV